MTHAETPDFKKLFGGGKLQRKYVSKISPVADELADLLIAHAIEVEDSQGVYWFYVDNDGCVAWSIRQSDNILGLALTQIGAPSNYWQQQWYKLGKTITQRIVATVQAKMQAPTKTQASESPEAPQVEAVVSNVPLTDENKGRVKGSYKDLLERIAKLEADLAAAQNIIVQAGKDFEALRNENARMKEDFATIAHKAKRIYNGDVDMESAKALALGIYSLSREDTAPTPPAQEAPKPSIAKRVRVNWSRGFSSGSYEVLGYSHDKQAYCVNISFDTEKPMPKMVKMADCLVVS